MEDLDYSYKLREKGYITASPINYLGIAHYVQSKKRIETSDYMEKIENNKNLFTKIWGQNFRILNCSQDNKVLRGYWNSDKLIYEP